MNQGEKKRAYCREYHWKNREKILERKRKYREENREIIREDALQRYYADKETGKLWKLNNREKVKEYQRRYREKNPNKKRDERLRREFGITFEQYEAMRIDQNNKCAICQNPETRVIGKSGKISDLAVDHCHATGVIRGLLCAKCNTAIGLFNDDIGLIENAIKYITRSRNGREEKAVG